MELLKLGVVQGVQACSLGVTILVEELERDAASGHAARAESSAPLTKVAMPVLAAGLGTRCAP